jgi:hypothetical protein
MVHDAQLDYYGKRLATCSSDRTVKVFDLSGDQKTLIADLRGHEGPIWQVSWAHPRYGSLLASASFDHRVIIWKEGPDGQWLQVGASAAAPSPADESSCQHATKLRAILLETKLRQGCAVPLPVGQHNTVVQCLCCAPGIQDTQLPYQQQQKGYQLAAKRATNARISLLAIFRAVLACPCLRRCTRPPRRCTQPV